MSRRQKSRSSRTIPDDTIDLLFGRGLSYNDWQEILEKDGFTWSGSLKNTIIRREFVYFKPEILRLKFEPHDTRRRRGRDQPDPNSAKSILKRLKGEKWMAGKPAERDERLHGRLLLGKDAKVRSLLNYLKEWETDGSYSLLSSGNVNAPSDWMFAPTISASDWTVSTHNARTENAVLDNTFPAHIGPVYWTTSGARPYSSAPHDQDFTWPAGEGNSFRRSSAGDFHEETALQWIDNRAAPTDNTYGSFKSPLNEKDDIFDILNDDFWKWDGTWDGENNAWKEAASSIRQ